MSQIDNLNNGGGDVKVAGKKKLFKKSDILVFAICIVAALLIWLYASNVKKTKDQNDLNKNKEAFEEVAESMQNKTTETSSESST